MQQYDCQVMQEMEAQGKQFGVEEIPLCKSENTGDYSFPVERKEFLFVTSVRNAARFARRDKTNAHGIYDATVTQCWQQKRAARSLPSEADKMQCTYKHLGEILVKAGDTVQAGQRLGLSGKSGEHLHFEVRQIHADGTQRDIDPAAYLAEIAQKGHIKQQVLHNGNDLLAKYIRCGQYQDDPFTRRMDEETALIGGQWRGSVGVRRPYRGYGNDRFYLPDVAGDANRQQERGRTKSSPVGGDGQPTIDLKSLLPGMKSCYLTVVENGRAVLQADNGSVRMSHELTYAELSRLSIALNDGTLSDETKRARVTSILNTVLLSEMASRNFE